MLGWRNNLIQKSHSKRVIAAAVDPGQKTTGLAWVEEDGGRYAWSVPTTTSVLRPEVIVARLIERKAELLIIESFTVRPQSGGKTASEVCELIGRIEATVNHTSSNAVLRFQNPRARVKAKATDALWQEWLVCRDQHCRDAAGHILAFMRETRLGSRLRDVQRSLKATER